MFYEVLSDQTIGRSTKDKEVANALGLTLQTEQEIVYGQNGKRYFKGNEPFPTEKSYVQKRAEAYPSIQDQLDMMYWDGINGTDRWRETIGAVKTKYPKK